jgi:hypothetical protein
MGINGTATPNPVRDYRVIVKDSKDPGYVNRILVGTPTTGLVRIEWVQSRFGQVIPTNWSNVIMYQYMNAYIPLRYQVDDAQNLIVKAVVEGDFEWLLLWEHDMIAPPDTMIRLNDYMRNENEPVVSALYFTRSRPSEPLVYRGRGTSFYTGWELGDLVRVDGIPTGLVLIHAGILRAMWEDSEEYQLGDTVTRRVFNTPRNQWFDQETGQHNTITGTSDLDWSTRVIDGGYLEKAGWTEHAAMEYPFLVDTNIVCKHINPNGEQFP